MPIAMEKLRTAQTQSGSLLCVGLEPSLDYLPPGMTADITGFKAMMRIIVRATRGLVCAYKFNLAFFDALGRDGTELLYATREIIPEDTLLIADGKRCDIGSSAQRYASALYDRLQVDASTINPLLGKDSVDAFLQYRDKLNIFLVLTSNPGAEDFLTEGGLYLRIAQRLQEWSSDDNMGFVVGATRSAEQIAELRSIAPRVPFLVPGIGAQGGAIETVVESGQASQEDPGLIFHVTRGILPKEGDEGDPVQIIQERTKRWRAAINEARGELQTGDI